MGEVQAEELVVEGLGNFLWYFSFHREFLQGTMPQSFLYFHKWFIHSEYKFE